jgi:phage tail-like protein
MIDYYPPWGFHFRVEFVGVSRNRNDVRFQSVSGLSVEYEYESFKEGGENRFEHKLPVRTRYADLVLKRGMLTDSAVIRWLLAAFQERSFSPTDISITLLNDHAEPLRTWNVTGAVPKKWLVSDFNSTENSLVIETMELAYRYFTIQE